MMRSRSTRDSALPGARREDSISQESAAAKSSLPAADQARCSSTRFQRTCAATIGS
jgi:hypothetical protein